MPDSRRYGRETRKEWHTLCRVTTKGEESLPVLPLRGSVRKVHSELSSRSSVLALNEPKALQFAR